MLLNSVIAIISSLTRSDIIFLYKSLIISRLLILFMSHTKFVYVSWNYRHKHSNPSLRIETKGLTGNKRNLPSLVYFN